MDQPTTHASEFLFLGQSPGAATVRRLACQAASVDVPVLICGESGVGKELVARDVHLASTRRRGRFVALNCAAIPDTLIESELFGHEPGAFTGASGRHHGAFEQSDGGTLFLDEIGDLSALAQPKLLRALEASEVVRVGGERPIEVDARVIAATNHPLRQMVGDGLFRPDLYYRLRVLEIHVPPLRERVEDIPFLAAHFASLAARKTGQGQVRFTAEALAVLARQRWPGNSRQLRNVVESALARNGKSVIEARDLDCEPDPVALPFSGLLGCGWREAQDGFQTAYVLHVLRQHGGNVARAAAAAGLARRSFYKILRRLDLRPDRPPVPSASAAAAPRGQGQGGR